MSHQLTVEEREVIAKMLEQGASNAAIGRALKRPGCTIGREIRRNHCGEYWASHAQRLADRRRQQGRAKSAKMQRAEVCEYVQQRLRKCWSPDQIAGRSRLDFPDDSRRQISRQTIYDWIANDDHRRRWIVYLRRYPHRKRPAPRKNRVSHPLSNRPQVVNDRQRFGDWEGDTIRGAGPSQEALVSLVERRSGYLALLPVRNHKAITVRRAIVGRLSRLSPELRHTLTLDNGSEFADHEVLHQQLGIDVFFTDPHSPWQRGTNENTNGLVRQYVPKGIRLRHVSRYKVAQAEHSLNDRPRKRLGYQTPYEAFTKQCQLAFQT